jgi:hypothetical protein
MLAMPELTMPPTCVGVVEPQFTSARISPEALVATESGSIHVVDTAISLDMELTNGPFVKMAVAPSGRMVAAYMHSGSLWVSGLDFQKNLTQLQMNQTDPPDQLVWCGTDAVLMSWGRLVVMAGPYADCVRYPHAIAVVVLCLVVVRVGVGVCS